MDCVHLPSLYPTCCEYNRYVVVVYNKRNVTKLHWSLQRVGSTNQDEDDAIIGVAATSVLAVGVAVIIAYKHESSILRELYVNKDQEREFYMNSILNESDVH
ncbi:hypothetical protein P3S68_017323 [Capsicum galapagoense]